MGDKLQLGNLSDSTRAVIEYENGVIVATTVGDIDHEKFANEIIAAVNVMPEVITFLRAVAEGQIKNRLRMQVLELRTAQILKQLEAVE